MDTQLKERILNLSDDELLEMVERKASQYRKEALDYASEELESRGIPFTLNTAEFEENAFAVSEGTRFLNLLLDSILIFIITLLFAALLGSSNTLLILFIDFAYYFVFETGIQKTPAKFITNTKVVMSDGSTPDAATIIKRTLIRYVPLEPFFPKGGKWWHDRWSDTEVVRDQ